MPQVLEGMTLAILPQEVHIGMDMRRPWACCDSTPATLPLQGHSVSCSVNFKPLCHSSQSIFLSRQMGT